MSDKYKGMTVNERLYSSGLIGKFDDAIREKDVNAIVSILKEVELSDYSIIDPILKQFDLQRD